MPVQRVAFRGRQPGGSRLPALLALFAICVPATMASGKGRNVDTNPSPPAAAARKDARKWGHALECKPLPDRPLLPSPEVTTCRTVASAWIRTGSSTCTPGHAAGAFPYASSMRSSGARMASRSTCPSAGCCRSARRTRIATSRAGSAGRTRMHGTGSARPRAPLPARRHARREVILLAGTCRRDPPGQAGKVLSPESPKRPAWAPHTPQQRSSKRHRTQSLDLTRRFGGGASPMAR